MKSGPIRVKTIGVYKPLIQRRSGMFDEDEPPRPKRRLTPLVLDTLGVDELGEYIAELRAEIERVEADIAKKQGHRSQAEAFFKTPLGE